MSKCRFQPQFNNLGCLGEGGSGRGGGAVEGGEVSHVILVCSLERFRKKFPSPSGIRLLGNISALNVIYIYAYTISVDVSS